MDDSSASSTTARNLRLSHAIAVAQRAVEADDAGVLDGDEGALALYEQAARALLGCLKAEPSAARRQLLRAKVNDLLYRAEELHRADGAATAAAAASASASAAGAGDGEVVVGAPAAGASGAPAPAAEAAGGEPAEPAAAVVDAVAAARSGLLGSSTGDSAAESRAAAVAAAAAAESRAARYAHLEQLAAESQAVPAEAVPGSGDEDSLGSSSTSMVEVAHPELAAAGGGGGGAAAADDDDDDDDDARVACDVVFNVDGVECFSVLSAAGERQRIAGPGTLQLLRVEGAPGLMLLRLEQFEFPLRVNIPCLRSARGMYVVPLASSGVCYAFAFPAQIHDAFLTAFEALLAPACQFRVSAGSDQPRGDVPAAATDAAAAAAAAGGGGAPAPSGSGSAAGAGAAGVDAASASPAAAAEAAADPGDFIDDDPTQQQQQALAVPGEGQPGSKVLVAADTTARGVTVASTYLVAGIQKGSEIVAGGVAKGGTAIKSRVGTAEKPLEVPEGVSRTVAAAKVVSPAVVNLSKALVKGLAVLAEEVGSAVATQIVERTRNESTGETAFDSPGAQAAKKVAGSVIVGVVDVWDALEDAGKTVLVQTKESTVDIVDHRWGTEAASVTGDSMDVVIDGYQTVRNVKSVGVKKIAKKVTKETVKETGRLYLGDSETADLRQRKRDELMITDAPKGDDSDDDAESFAASATAAARALDPHKLLEITRGRKGADSSSGAAASSGGAEHETTPTQQETAPTPATPATPASPDEVTPTPSPAVGL